MTALALPELVEPEVVELEVVEPEPAELEELVEPVEEDELDLGAVRVPVVAALALTVLCLASAGS